MSSGPLPQRGYLWQREWTAAMPGALREADAHFDGIVVLAAEIVWRDGAPQAIRPTLDFEALRKLRQPCALAMRIAPFGGPFMENDRNVQFLVSTAAAILRQARERGLKVEEFQVDFDCADRKLDGYRTWLHALKPVVHPARMVITVLPSWLNESAFAPLVREAGSYVLQVHSVPMRDRSGQASLCDPDQARAWVEQAARAGVPFAVALPTFRCTAGYDSGTGQLLGVAMDGLQPAWPPQTHLLNFATDAHGMAGLVHGWQAHRPAHLHELLWYRVPVASDVRNWRWPTLAAVMSGREPAEKLEASGTGENPLDIALINTGETDEELRVQVIARWDGDAAAEAADALPGWSVALGPGRAVFFPAARAALRLPPGARRSIGWLRYETQTAVRFEVELLPAN